MKANTLNLTKLNNASWRKAITTVQQEILSAPDIHPYYKRYRRSEVGYWAPIAKQLFQMPTGRVLDIGAAYGTLVVFLARLGWKASVVDQFDIYLAPSIREKYGIDFHAQNVEIESLPFADNVFDCVLFTEILEHINYNPLPVIKEIHRVLAPSGVLLLSTPDKNSWGESEHKAPFEEIPFYRDGDIIKDAHMKIYDEAELCRLLQKAGFKNIHIKEHKPMRLVRVRFQFKRLTHLIAVATKH